MKLKKILFSGGFPLLILAACNLSASDGSSTIHWNSLLATPPTETQTAIPHPVSTDTITPPATTITPTPSYTQNPLGVSRLAPGTSIDILQIEMIDAQVGWGIGGPRASGSSSHVFRTSDGGVSWMEVTPPEIASDTSELASLSAAGYFPDSQSGWVTYHAYRPSAVPSAPVVWKTVDGGRSWTAGSPLSTVDLTETFFVSHIVFADAGNGWVLAHVGAGMNHDYVALYRSVDGGASWSRVIDPIVDGGIQSCSKTGIVFADGSAGWLTGDCNGVRPGAFLFRTTDGGVHWVPADLPPPSDHPDLFTADQYACGVRAPFRLDTLTFFGIECTDMAAAGDSKIRYLYRSTAGGNFVSQAYPGGAVFTLDGTRIWALGKEIFRSENGGGAWAKISTVTWDGQFDFVTSLSGWAAVRKDSEYGLVRTDDGGGLWAQLTPVVVAGA